MSSPGMDRDFRELSGCGDSASWPQQGRFGADWATTPLYFSAEQINAGMRRFCMGLIVLLAIVGAQALGVEDTAPAHSHSLANPLIPVLLQSQQASSHGAPLGMPLS